LDLSTILYSVAAFVHAHIAIVSVATILVVLATLFGDALDLAIYAIGKKTWRALLSLNVILEILGADPANATAAGAAALAFLGTLGAGAGYRAAAIAALAAIGTVNTGYLLGADRAKFAIVLAAIFPKKLAAPSA